MEKSKKECLNNPVLFSVGSRFPFEKYLTGNELTISIINSDFIDVLVSYKNISKGEIQCWKKSSLMVSLYEKDSIPYIIFDFGGWNFDVSIVTNRMPEETLDDWLNSRSNLIHMFLVDADTGTLLNIRTIGLNMKFADLIRDICEKQTFIDSNIVEENHRKIYSEFTTVDMTNQAQYCQKFYKPLFY